MGKTVLCLLSPCPVLLWEFNPLWGLSDAHPLGSYLVAHGDWGLRSASPQPWCLSSRKGCNCFYQCLIRWLWLSHKESQTWLKWMYYSKLIFFHSKVYIPTTLNNELRKKVTSKAFPRMNTFWNDTFGTNWTNETVAAAGNQVGLQGAVFFKSRICLIK